jgi:hypothetical protein
MSLKFKGEKLKKNRKTIFIIINFGIILIIIFWLE